MYSSVQMDAADENTLMHQLNASPHSSPARTPDTPNNSCLPYSQPSSEAGEECAEEEVHEVSQQSQLAQQDEEKAVEAQPESDEEKAVEAQPESEEEKAVEVQPKPVKEEAVEVQPKPVKEEAVEVKSRPVKASRMRETKSPKRVINIPRGFTSSALPPKGARRSYGQASCLSVASADQ